MRACMNVMSAGCLDNCSDCPRPERCSPSAVRLKSAMVEQLIDNDMSELLDTMRLGYLRNKCIRNRVTSVRQLADLTQEGVEKVGF